MSIGLVVCFSGIGCLFSNIALSENNYNAQATLESSTFSNVLTKPYRVKRGDSLWKLQKYRPSKRITTSDMLVAIKKLNKYKLNGNSALSVGMRLSLPKSITSVKEILSAKPTPKPKIKTPKPIVKKLETKKLTKEVTRKEASLNISAKPINSSSAVYQPLDPKKLVLRITLQK